MTKSDHPPKKVLFISNVPSPYNVEYLNELGKLRTVTAVFERGSSSERDKSWMSLRVQNFDCQILKGVHTAVDAALSPGVLRYIHHHRTGHIIIGNPATPTGILAILYCKIFRIPYILQSEGGVAGSGRGPKERFKYFLMKDAVCYLSGMRKNEYFLTYGATPDRVKQYPFASLHRKDMLTCAPTPEEKQALRRELGIDAERMVLYVGRFIYGKGMDILLRACAGLPAGTALVAVGGQPTEEYIKMQQQLKLSSVFYVDHADLQTLKKYYMAADIFVLPTRGDTWGLVVNEAMSYGLGVITTDACVAGLNLIENGVNGYVIPSEDPQTLHSALCRVLEDPQHAVQLGKCALETIQDYSYENMAATIDSALAALNG